MRGPREACAGQYPANRNHGRSLDPIRSRTPTAASRWRVAIVRDALLADRAAPGAGRECGDERAGHLLVAVPVAKCRVEERSERRNGAEVAAGRAAVAQRPVAEV